MEEEEEGWTEGKNILGMKCGCVRGRAKGAGGKSLEKWKIETLHKN